MSAIEKKSKAAEYSAGVLTWESLKQFKVFLGKLNKDHDRTNNK